ncbi:beta-ketoacyl synthase domain-containing protein [Botrytis cinerea]
MKEKQQYPIATKVVKASKINILDVFTGQGAQWVSMGAELFLYSASFRHTIESLELTLKGIVNGSTWSLTKDLMNKSNPERSLSAEISQPLCTAIQVALVDLLKVFGLDSGKMMAVEMAPEDAGEFCLQKQFLGRISVAANNSPSSVTLAGDRNAIDEVKEILNEKAIFARMLKVDTAYHSHHMECVREPYIESLQKADILPKRKIFEGSCNWYFSVYNLGNDHSMSSDVSFEQIYWADNMVRSVLFSSAVISAISKEHFNLVLEIGPHPVLKGPTTECIRLASDNQMSYHGALQRQENSVNIFSNALDFVWRNIDSSNLSVDFKAFQKSCNRPKWTIPRVHEGLQPYPWNHDKNMLRESKKSKIWRTRRTPFHELLGYPSSNGDIRELHRRNILRLADVEWLQVHQFQHQVLFPVAAYLVMAVKAALYLFEHAKQPFRLVELQDFMIHNAIT